METYKIQEVTEKDEQKIEKHDQLIYDIIRERFRLEWQRIINLDSKASGIIGFVGIIISLQAGLGGFLLNAVPRDSNFYCPLCALFLSGIILLMCSILCGLKAYYVKAWKIVPETKRFIEECAKKDRSRIDILRMVSQDLSEAVTYNSANNDIKAKCIKIGLGFLIFGIVFVILFVGLLVVV
jgi:hypothetical protein